MMGSTSPKTTASENGDCLARFKRMEKTLAMRIEGSNRRRTTSQRRLTVQQKQADKADSRIENLATELGGLVGAICSLIDHIPPENPRYASPPSRS